MSVCESETLTCTSRAEDALVPVARLSADTKPTVGRRMPNPSRLTTRPAHRPRYYQRPGRDFLPLPPLAISPTLDASSVRSC